MKKLLSLGISALVLTLVVAGAVFTWDKYMYTPWTRDGRVRADVINISPDVSGWITTLKARNSMEVKKGDILFVVDRERYQVAYEQSKAQEKQAEASWQRAESIANRRARLPNAVSREDIENSRLDAAVAQASYEAAKTQTKAALLDLNRTVYRAPEDGKIINLDLEEGDYVEKGAKKLALVVKDSYYLTGYFEETKLPGIRVGDHADIWLMAGTQHINGRVTSIDAGISNDNITPGNQLLPDVEPGFSWIRLAQRIPVNIEIENPANEIVLSSGMSATVRIDSHEERKQAESSGLRSIFSDIAAVYK